MYCLSFYMCCFTLWPYNSCILYELSRITRWSHVKLQYTLIWLKKRSTFKKIKFRNLSSVNNSSCVGWAIDGIIVGRLMSKCLIFFSDQKASNIWKAYGFVDMLSKASFIWFVLVFQWGAQLGLELIRDKIS